MKKIYSKPLIDIEAYELNASIAANCGSVISLGPECIGVDEGSVCKELKDGYEVHSVIPGLGIQSVTGGTPFYNDGSANCDCYYQSGGSGYFTS